MLRLAIAALIALALACPAACAALSDADVTMPDATGRPAGTLLMQACPRLPAQCGRLVRPLDPTGRVPGTIAIAFLWFPRLHAGTPAAGTIVATEGGPGYATTSSRGA
jgi:hypothetical protein